MFKIEKAQGFPMLREKVAWPWGDMEVGDLVRFEDKGIAARAQKAVHPYAKHHGKKFVTKTKDGVLHVCRVE